MSEFLSWIENDSKIYFLTGDQLFRTTRGKAVLAYAECLSDRYGHGIIRKYYHDLRYGINRDCPDFSTPANFPPEIVSALKSGRMKGFPFPGEGLLLETANKASQEGVTRAEAAYQEVWTPAWIAYQATKSPIWKTFDKARAPAQEVLYAAKAAAREEYLVDKAPTKGLLAATARKFYQAAVGRAEAAYQETIAPAEAARSKLDAASLRAFEEAVNPAWQAVQDAKDVAWDLFAIPENRQPAWK